MSLSPPPSPSSPPLSPFAPVSTQSNTTFPSPGRARSRTFSQAEADEKLEREEESQRARDGGGEGQEGVISAGELRAEMETLLSLRRRSLSQPATLDPDLPPPSPTSPTHAHSRPHLTITTSPPMSTSPSGVPLSPTAPTAAETGTLVRRRSSTTSRLPSDHPLPLPPPPSPTLPSPWSPTTDGAAAAHSSQDLFWLPASLHPELAPQEFKAFIREQTRPDNLARKSSLSGAGTYGSGRVERKKSMLRGEYKPRTDDGVGEAGKGREQLVERRTTSKLNFEELTIGDLQRLEELAAGAEAEAITAGEGEGERLGRVLRRSLSLNPNDVAAAVAEGAHLSPHRSDSSRDRDQPLSPDSPLIVPPPGQILRRSARTKIRKVGLVGDGGGHRFGPSRRGGRTSTGGESLVSVEETDSVGDVSFDSMESEEIKVPLSVEDEEDRIVGSRLSTGSITSSSDHQYAVQHVEQQVPSLTADAHFATSLIDSAWAVDQAPYAAFTPLPPSPISPPLQEPTPPSPPASSIVDPSSADFDWSTHRQQQQPAPILDPTPTSSAPQTHHVEAPIERPRTQSVPPPIVIQPVPVPPRPGSVRDGKEKKSGWARLGLSGRGGGDDDEGTGRRKKGKGKEVDKVVEVVKEAPKVVEREREKDKEKEPGFFGGLFGGGKRKNEQEQQVQPLPSPPAPEARTPPPPPTASGVLMPNGLYTNFYRLPIHVERAIYRLSHIKLANPRRPLYEQVLISNLMFWYLSIINKPPTPIPTAPPIPVPGTRNQQPQQPTSNGTPEDGRAHEGPPEREREQRPPAKESQKRPGLSKPARQPGRSAEMPVRQPDFQQQDRQLDQEQHQHHNHQQQQQQQHSRPPLVSSPVVPSPPPPSRSPDRSSAPAELYSRVVEDDDDDDDRPLAAQRESYPPHRPIPVASYPKKDPGFEVTSRNASREKPSLAQDGARVPGSRPVVHRRNISGGESNSSFDLGEIFDAYSAVSPHSSPPAGFATELNIDPALAILGTVAPRSAERKRGESLTGRPGDAGVGELAEPPSPPPGRGGKEGRPEMRRRQQTAPVGGEVRSTREYR